MFVFTLHVLTLRPYRSTSSNLLYMVGLVAVTMQAGFLYARVAEYGQPIFIDKYFIILTAILNGFLWFLILMLLVFLCIVKYKWPVDRAVVSELTENQDLAIYYIKESRKFQIDVLQRKQYTKDDSVRMANLLEELNLQHN